MVSVSKSTTIFTHDHSNNHFQTSILIRSKNIDLDRNLRQQNRIERIQSHNENKFLHTDIPFQAILSGETITNQKEIEKLTKEISQTTAAIVQILDKTMPKPLERIFYTDVWKNSVYHGLDGLDTDVLHAFDLFEKKILSMSLSDYLEYLSEKNYVNLILRSSTTRIYMSLEDSLKILKKWLLFQFGNEYIGFIQNIINWIRKKNFKKGGFLVMGPANGGKSFFMGARMDLFIFVGLCHQSMGYAFNFDDFIKKQIILCEEFQLNPMTRRQLKY